MSKSGLSERDICSKFITPALCGSGWNPMLQIREEVSFTAGRIIVRGKLVSLDLPRFDAAPVSHLSDLSFEGQGTFPPQS